jgi:phospholipid/cholesterol/gamma-HCH transport system substrate-binding protein
MISRLAKAQLVLFVVVSVLALVYGATTLLNVGSVIKPPYVVEAQFASPGGIYPRADVDLLGTRVGRVKELKPGPGSGTTVVLAIDDGVEIPADLTATIGSKSAIGEAYVALTPRSDTGRHLTDGDTIPLKRTVSPPDFAELIANLSSLAGSVPTEDVATVLNELSVAFDGAAPSLGRLLDASHTITEASLKNVEALTGLIDSAATVLDTQVEVGPQTTTYLAQLAGLTDRLRELDATFDQVFVNGIQAGTEVTDLLSANQDAIPVLLNNLVTLTDVAAARIPGLRKTLVTFPYVLEIAQTGVRYCDALDAKTGKPIEKTCHYDENGDPIWAAYLAAQMPEQPLKPPYRPCTKGYEDTVRYLPDGTPLSGTGRKQQVDSDPNPNARCAALPTDPFSPNVRGGQNAHQSLALYNPRSGFLATPDGAAYHLSGVTGEDPPSGPEGLGWLLIQPLS